VHRPHRDELSTDSNGVAAAPAVPRAANGIELEDTTASHTAGHANDTETFEPEVQAAILNRVTGELVCVFVSVRLRLRASPSA